MKLKKLVVIGAFVALAVALCATASSLFWVCRKVRAFEAEHGGSVYANLSKAQMDEIIKAKIKEAATNAAPASASAVVQQSPEPAADKPKGPPPPPKPMVRFAAPGRYLPPGGARAIGVESVNVTNIHAEIRRVVPENVVQLLAREEREYSRYRWGGSADNEETEELSGEIEEHDFACVNRPNEKETVAVPVKMNDGGSANGIFLVAVRSADRPRADGWWVDEPKQNPNRYRLVCLSDLGLSVRLNGTESPGVWVTSLMKGTPLDGAKVTVYSKANIKVMEGETDENGWSRLVRVAKGEPFAVVATSADGADSTFLALRDSMEVDETYPDGCRPEYLADDGVEAFLWTDRGIYRHDEKIMVHALLRNGRRQAPSPMPVELRLVSPKGDIYFRLTMTTDAEGSLLCDTFTVPADQPSGAWKFQAKIPGKDGRILGTAGIKVEEFAPPQIRVKVEADASAHPSNFAFFVSAEHLFGGPAHALACEGAVVFEDYSFAPPQWKGWSFGNCDLGLKPNFRTLLKTSLDREGKCVMSAPLWADSGLPKAAVRATAQGTVFEDGGRPATARASAVLHYYPYYIGSTLESWMRLDNGLAPKIRFACVKPDGSRHGETRTLSATLERIDSVYSYRRQSNGWETWDCERIRKIVASSVKIVVPAGEDATFEIPAGTCGDYALTVTDSETGVSFAKTFYLSDWGDSAVRAPLSDPTAVTLTTDKPFYRVGETPRLMVRAPFAGYALVSVLRDKDAYTDIVALTNATSEIALRSVTLENAPNLDVYVSVVQSVEANAKHMAARAHGQATISVRPVEDEIAVKVEKCDVVVGSEKGSSATVTFEARGASAALVTIVDEGINILTDEQVPDPVAHFAAPRYASHPLYDIYHRMLPVLGEDLLRASGVKTGGGAGAEMLGRVSPVPTRRFKPLSRWSGRVKVGEDGKGVCEFPLGEFVGEIRATVVAWSASASGSDAIQAKVTPKIVMMPDAPRFVAPGDVFEATLPIYRRDGNSRVEHVERVDGVIEYSISVGRNVVVAEGKVMLENDGHTNIVVRLTAPEEPGEMGVAYSVKGLGEAHHERIILPVRPAVAWVETSGITASEKLADTVGKVGRLEKLFTKEYDTPLGGYEAALRWLAEYPHGCLEQTSSRMFPLIGAGGILASVSPAGPDVVSSGVRRVESMVRSTDFVMWPDCNYAPWDPEVSLYAAHFLVEAEKNGYALNRLARDRVFSFLKRWAMSTNDTVSAYACHTLALAGKPEKDRMLRLYDASTNLTLLSRSRLARAFALTGDRRRAETLLAANVAPSSVKDASFAVLALLDVDPDDSRILPLVSYLDRQRDRERFSWGTTGDNAHALLAIGAYYRHHPAKTGEKFVVWHKLSLPKPRDVRDESRGISIVRRYLTPEGGEADLSKLSLGEMLIAELAIKVDDTRELSDLVLEDLLPACFEPVHGGLVPKRASADPSDPRGANEGASAHALDQGKWVMRSDARDDRMLVFSKKFTLAKGEEATFRYPVRVVSAGDYILPGPSVEAMYHPDLHARRAPSRISVRR
ncbi:MAG: hypothetical protein IJG18_07375 [Kiritimatiellae bacterium]|nr:hypothetical protein [Kiritimatiellia bacterium]